MTFSCYACEEYKEQEISRGASLSPRQERLKNCDIGIYYRKKHLDPHEVMDILGLLGDRSYESPTPIVEDEKHRLTVHFRSFDLFKENLRKKPEKELKIISLQRNILSQGRISFDVGFKIIGEAYQYYFTLAVENKFESLGISPINLASLNSSKKIASISSSGPLKKEKEREAQETSSFSSSGKKRLGRSSSFTSKLKGRLPFSKKDSSSNLLEEKVVGDRSRATTSPPSVSSSSKNGSSDILSPSPKAKRTYGIRRKKSEEREKLRERKELKKSKSSSDVGGTQESFSIVTGIPKGTIKEMAKRADQSLSPMSPSMSIGGKKDSSSYAWQRVGPLVPTSSSPKKGEGRSNTLSTSSETRESLRRSLSVNNLPKYKFPPKVEGLPKVGGVPKGTVKQMVERINNNKG